MDKVRKVTGNIFRWAAYIAMVYVGLVVLALIGMGIYAASKGEFAHYWAMLMSV